MSGIGCWGKRPRNDKRVLLATALLSVGAAAMAGAGIFRQVARPVEEGPTRVRWRKTVVDPAFRSEGVAVADVDRDGKTDVIVGDYWYQAPAWTRHEIRPPLTNLGDGNGTYSEAFACFAGDFNSDRWPDVLIIGFPGKPAVWYENPGKRQPPFSHWKQHPVAHSACNETPIFADLFGDGRRYLVMATQPEGQMFWLSPSPDPEKPWVRHPISMPSTREAKTPGTEVFSHGLGAGDVNGDGRADILIKEGWWEQPAYARRTEAPWKFHPADLGEGCANIHVFDVNGDRLPDALTSSAHRRGIWWHERQKGGNSFTRHLIADSFTQTHALNAADINGDGRRDFVTGKRWWAHGPTGDVDPNAAPVLYWFEIKQDKNSPLSEFIGHRIDDASGVGTQFVTEDINNDRRVDIVVSNKRGVFVFEQQRR